MKRIKEHKNRETVGLDSKKQASMNGTSSSLETTNINENINSYTDEFNDSIEYLQTLSKQKKTEQKKPD